MGPIRNPRWEQKRTEGYVIVSIYVYAPCGPLIGESINLWLMTYVPFSEKEVPCPGTKSRKSECIKDLHSLDKDYLIIWQILQFPDKVIYTNHYIVAVCIFSYLDSQLIKLPSCISWLYQIQIQIQNVIVIKQYSLWQLFKLYK
jgi:hypothetical protein